MPSSPLLAGACCVLIASSCGRSAEPRLLSSPEASPAVWGVLEIPEGTTPHPAILLLHGSSGWRADYARLASILADSGFVALAIDYYADAGSSPIGSAEKLAKWPTYQASVRNAVAYLQSLSSVSGQPIALVGFSRGAFLAVSVAGSTPGVDAVIDFYGGGGGGTDALAHEVRGFPPLLILHGDADSTVPVRFAYALRDAVIAAGGDVELHVLPGARHAFNAPWSPTYAAPATRNADRWMFAFLRHRLAAAEAR